MKKMKSLIHFRSTQIKRNGQVNKCRKNNEGALWQIFPFRKKKLSPTVILADSNDVSEVTTDKIMLNAEKQI